MSTTIQLSPNATLVSHDPRRNYLLAALPEDILTRLQSCFELVQLSAGEVICWSGCKANHIYFPTTSIISLLYASEEGESSEIALIGREGFVGLGEFV